MKRLCYLFVLVLTVCTFACGNYLNDLAGDDDDPAAPDSISGAKVIASTDELPVCDADTDGQLYYVQGLDQFMVCDGTEYQVIDLTGPAGEDSSSHPFVVYTSPSDNKAGVAVDAVIQVVFNTDIDESSVTTGASGTFRVMDAGDNLIDGAVACSDTVVEFTPAEALTKDEKYTVSLCSAIKNVVGVAMGYEHVFSFETMEYKLRDRGPANGWIFYINPDADVDGWKYLEAAEVDLTNSIWGTFDYDVSGADGTAIGTGEQNTLDIIASDTATDKAADRCAAYSVDDGGIIYDDWFLPSKDELNLIYENLHSAGAGGFATTAYYWSSSEDSSYSAWTQYFLNGTQNYGNKVNGRRVRAARAF